MKDTCFLTLPGFFHFFQDADDDVIELEKEVEARVEPQAECDSTNDTSPDVVPYVTTIMDSDLQVTILAKLCANFVTKEKNAGCKCHM